MRIRIRTKLTVALALPLVLIVGLTGAGIFVSLQDVDDYRERAATLRATAALVSADKRPALESLARAAQHDVDSTELRIKVMAAAGATALLLTLLLSRMASRAMTRPLHSLRKQADDMAEHRLPGAVREILGTPASADVLPPVLEPIAVKSRDEFRDIADALNVVQQRALELALEQVVLRRNINDSYVNLGRRNQNLLNRQIELITELETNETDPDALDGLFRLDHLATRMRRNAESLLVLAGVEPPRRWSAPVGIADVIRAASSEVEDYQRVEVGHLEPATLVGAAATDLAHVLAELLENALTFSPNDEVVEVLGELTPGGYVLSVIDNGIGMKADDLDRSNRRLAGTEEFTVAPSRFVGHYVAGHLASRLGVAVAVSVGRSGGTTARVTIPLRLVNQGGDSSAVPADADANEVDEAASAASAASATSEHQPMPAAASLAAIESGWAEPAPAEVERIAVHPLAPVTLPELARREYTGPRHFAGKAKDESALDAAPQSDDSPVIDDVPVIQPLPTATARGFGGLAVAGDGDAPTDEGTTANGLARRVPGAQHPIGVPMRSRAADTTEEQDRSTPEDVFAFLSSFTSGVERGHADAAKEGEGA